MFFQLSISRTVLDMRLLSQRGSSEITHVWCVASVLVTALLSQAKRTRMVSVPTAYLILPTVSQRPPVLVPKISQQLASQHDHKRSAIACWQWRKMNS